MIDIFLTLIICGALAYPIFAFIALIASLIVHLLGGD